MTQPPPEDDPTAPDSPPREPDDQTSPPGLGSANPDGDLQAESEPPHVRAERVSREYQEEVAAPRIAKAAGLVPNAELAARAQVTAEGLTSVPWLGKLFEDFTKAQTLGAYAAQLVRDDWLKETVRGTALAQDWISDSAARWMPDIALPSADLLAGITRGIDLAALANPGHSALRDFGVPETLRAAAAGLWTIPAAPLFDVQGLVSGLWGHHESAIASIFDGLSGLIGDSRWADLPTNLHGLDLDPHQVQALADEGLTIWAVPRPELVDRLLAARDKQARRSILGRAWERILDDCEDVVARTTGGAHGSQARFLAQAISALRDGHTAAGQALAGNVLDSVLWMSIPKNERRRLTKHRAPIKHFDELTLGAAMVFRPIWRAYRPQGEPSERAGDSTFARHGTAHNLTPRQVSRTSAVQAVMLATALLEYLTFWAQD